MPLSLNEFQDLIQQGENTQVEFKRQLSEDVLQKLSTSIAAMANADGGHIIFGVDNDKDPVGVELKGGEGERISQAATNCRPQVKIDYQELSLGTRIFLVVEVHQSTTVHSDANNKFPLRVGKVIDYLDSMGVTLLLRDRGSLKEVEVPGGPQRRERRPLSSSQAAEMARVLAEGDDFTRLEVLKDLSRLDVDHPILEHAEIGNQVKNVLQSGNEEELTLALGLVRYALNAGSDKERKAIEPWLDRILEVARTSSGPIAQRALEVLQMAGDKRTVDVLVHWITHADDEAFRSLNVKNLPSNVKFYGLDFPIRQAMYALLDGGLAESARGRVSEVLEAVRSAYG